MIAALKESISINYLLMVVGIISFKTTLDKSGALPAFRNLSSSGLAARHNPVYTSVYCRDINRHYCCLCRRNISIDISYASGKRIQHWPYGLCIAGGILVYCFRQCICVLF